MESPFICFPEIPDNPELPEIPEFPQIPENPGFPAYPGPSGPSPIITFLPAVPLTAPPLLVAPQFLFAAAQ